MERSGSPSRRFRPGRERVRTAMGRWALARSCGVALGLLAIPFAPGQADPPDPPTRLSIAAPLLTKLQSLAAGLHLELVLCLNGDVEAEGVHLTDFTMPEPHMTGRDRTLVGACPDGTSAVWHNHPLPNNSTTVASRGSTPRRWREPVTPRELCLLSRRDIDTTVRNAYSFIVVSVDADTWCWWSLDQVKEFARKRLAVGRPVPGQAHWAPGPPRSPGAKGLS